VPICAAGILAGRSYNTRISVVPICAVQMWPGRMRAVPFLMLRIAARRILRQR
jgi:hypothetical protein